MDANTARTLIDEEVRRARIKHPVWPGDTIYAAGIICEEAGEVMKAALEHRFEGKSYDECTKEAIQTAATCIRFLEGR